jgi:hypothetical protein
VDDPYTRVLRKAFFSRVARGTFTVLNFTLYRRHKRLDPMSRVGLVVRV